MGIAFLWLVLCTAPTPEILCIGDSITHGWARQIEWECPHENCGSSRKVVERVAEWQEGKHWNTIVFNCGIHDVMKGVPIEEYKANLRTIIHRLHADRIFFCNTTPGRNEEPHGVEPEKIDRYNAAAMEVMRAEKVPVIDIYGPAMAHREWWRENSRDVHYTPEGYAKMAEIVQKAISNNHRKELN
jgi:lysophospholipase L1-like esterase